jgi:hypothetical protein
MVPITGKTLAVPISWDSRETNKANSRKPVGPRISL